MDHTLDELDACIYDYLVIHSNEPKTFMEIYEDISGSTGHRCSALQNMSNKIKYKDQFIITCYSLEKTYNNIYKLFKQDLPYLMFSSKTYEEVVRDLNISYSDAPSYELNTMKIDTIVDSLVTYMKSTTDDNYVKLDLDSHLLQYLVWNNDTVKFKKLLDAFYIDVNMEINGKTLVTTAFESGHVEMVKLLMDEKLLQLESKFNVENNEVKKFNSKLSLSNNELQLANTKLQLANTKLTAENKTLKHEINGNSRFKNLFIGSFFGLFFGLFVTFFILK